MPSLLSIIPLQLFFTVWAGGFCGGFVAFPLGLIPMIQSPPGTEMAAEYFLTCLAPVAFFAVPAFFGVPIVAYWSKKRRYAKPEYRFFPTSLEYHESFFTVEQKTITIASSPRSQRAKDRSSACTVSATSSCLRRPPARWPGLPAAAWCCRISNILTSSTSRSEA